MTNRGHVSPDELIDLVDGAAAERSRTHVEVCAACRDQLATLKAALLLARTDRVPEPSSLFWPHFSARVSDAISQEPDVSPRWGIPTGFRWWLIPGVAAAACAIILTVVPLRQSGRLPVVPGALGPPAAVGLRPIAVALARPEDGLAPSAADGSWELVTALTADCVESVGPCVEFDPVPGSADRAVEQLSGDEQGELTRLLEAALERRPG